MAPSDPVPPSPALRPGTGSLVPNGVPLNAEGVPSGEACPPPLVWQEVLAAFRNDSQPWQVEQGSRRLQGRTWGDGPPLYLLPGFVATGELFALMIYLLRDQYRCIIYDTTSRPRARRRPGIEDYAADLQAAMDYHGDPSAHVFAANLGSAAALQTARDCPDRIRSLVCLHGLTNRRLSWTEWLLASACLWTSRPLAALPGRRSIQESNHRRWFPPFDGTRFEFLVDSTGQIPLRDLAFKALAIHRAAAPDLQDLRIPILLIRTEGQGSREADSHDALQKQLPGAATEWLHSTGLHPYLTHPHRLAKLIKGFCTEVSHDHQAVPRGAIRP